MWWFRGRNTHSQLCYTVPQREISFRPQMVLSLCLKAWGLIAIVNFTLASVTKLDCSLLSITCPSPGPCRITILSLITGFMAFMFAVFSICSSAIQGLVLLFYMMSHTIVFFLDNSLAQCFWLNWKWFFSVRCSRRCTYPMSVLCQLDSSCLLFWTWEPWLWQELKSMLRTDTLRLLSHCSVLKGSKLGLEHYHTLQILTSAAFEGKVRTSARHSVLSLSTSCKTDIMYPQLKTLECQVLLEKRILFYCSVYVTFGPKLMKVPWIQLKQRPGSFYQALVHFICYIPI